jgi:hypothetical protein
MKKYFLLSIVLAVISTGLHAQEFKKTESIRDQLKNNSVPGFKYSSANVAKSTTPIENKQSKTVTADGQQAQLTSSKATVKDETAAKQIPAPVITGQGNVTYEQAEEQAKKQMPAAPKIPAVPTQEEKPKEEKKQQQ